MPHCELKLEIPARVGVVKRLEYSVLSIEISGSGAFQASGYINFTDWVSKMNLVPLVRLRNVDDNDMCLIM